MRAKLYDDTTTGKKVAVSFRKILKEISSTTHSVFGLYKYPAKFIPQVPAYVLKHYAKKGMRVFDPFAGYGTVGLTARLYGCDYELWDLNPMLNVIHQSAILDISNVSKIDLQKLMKEIKACREEFLPNWSALNRWIPEEFLDMLSKVWGFFHSTKDESIKNLIVLPLLKITRYFSYSDEKIHKLYKSKKALKKIEELLSKNWKELFFTMLEKNIEKHIEKLKEYSKLNPEEVNYIVKASVDVMETNLENQANILITSPPYLQAQEYIRSTKLELFWLGFSEDYIKSLSSKEIPYRKAKEVHIQSEIFYKLRNYIEEEHIRSLYDRYFYALISALEKLSSMVADYIFIFVGPAKVRGIPVPIDDIIVEHFGNLGWEHEITFVDTIVARSMF
ncbi:MAG: hypothetical protein ACP5P0_05440, partial [Hydrogenobacter sp.]